MSGYGWVLLMSLGLAWGGSFIFIEILLEENLPFTIVFYRVFFAALFMIAFMWLSGRSLPKAPKTIMTLFLMGLINNAIPFSAITYGQQYITGGLASIINTNTAFLAIILSSIFLADERITANRLAGVLLGIVGVIIAIDPVAVLDVSVSNIGQQCILLATVCYATSTVITRKFIRGVDPVAAVSVMLTSSTFWMFWIVMLMEGPPVLTPSATGFTTIFALAIFSTSLAYVFYFKLLDISGAGITAVVTIIIPPITMIFDAVALREAITFEQIIGLGFIILGLLLLARGAPLSTSGVIKINANKTR